MKKVLLPFLAIISLASCQKTDEEVPETKEVFLLTEMTDDDLFFKFKYNEANQVTSFDLTADAPPAPVSTHTITVAYQNGKVIELNIDPSSMYAVFSTKIVYDSKGNMTEAIRPALKDTTRFTYDDKGRMTSHSFKAGGSIIGDEWSYDANGNVKIDEKHNLNYTNPGKIHISDTYETHTNIYDNKLNPLALNGVRQLIAALGLADETNIERIFSSNNPVSKLRQWRTVPINPASSGHELITYASSYTNTYDEYGYLLTTKQKHKTEGFRDGVLQEFPSGESVIDIVKYSLKKVNR
ncbi:MAG: hypothetical protein ACTHMC_06550 [Pseudobacter sp.]|uniref:hypothetical protein n=1 Tax=Pseudobacter sp. TaxID=2045420 RepID=UPI003F7E8065